MKKWIMALVILLGTSSIASAEEKNIEKPEALFSQSAIIIDSKTNSVLFSKNAHKKMNPASITKVATAIYALEHSNVQDTVTISKHATDTEGSTVFLLPEEQVTLNQLLQGMMINSGNDAAVAIAEHTEGSEVKFMNKLNEFLIEEVGVKNTHFENPHGLFGENHYTTAYDMAKITSYALKNKEFQELFGKKSMDWSSKGWDTTLYNHHKMVKGELPYPEVTGGKNGYINESKHTLVTSAENEELSIVVVALKAQSKKAIYSDTKGLLDYGLNSFTESYIPKGTVFQYKDKSYKLSENFNYTQPISGNITEKLNADGELTLYNQDHEKISSIYLNEMKKQSSLKQESTLASSEKGSTVHKNDLHSQILFYPFFLYMIILLIAGITIIRKKESL
ncbi:D-alanyl-D-alanine carboxypeptidase family protein [Rossellomorea aquimaris]|uniref:D-alanyl-D-alanine carboxypeptidase family protein n=1 Tax=Rossellomorea aquimaris TaxID=189382 RepID=UPI0007D0A912|nr:D-alanyl-D-alanine carboxypeptidase family protein [Rossellomorea aquimaris]